MNLRFCWGFVVFVFAAAYAVGGSLITFNNNGGWCWYQDERVIVHDNQLIIGSVANASGTGGASRWGNIEVVTHDIATGVTSAPFVLHPNLEADDHDLPAFLARPDGRILAVYSRHGNDKYARYRITTNPDDTASWEDELTYYHEPSNDNVTYSNVFRLSDEDGRIYNFFRGTNYNPTFIYSDDDGETWTYHNGHFIRKDGHRPYVKYASNNVDKVHFITTEGHPRNYNNSIYHGYLSNGKIYNSAGVEIDGDIYDTTVYEPNQYTQVFAANTVVNNIPMTRAWTVDFALDSSGNPYAVFQARIDPGTLSEGTDSVDHLFFYARYDGSSWNVHQLAYAGRDIYAASPDGAEDDYTGLVALDPQNPDRLYISTDVDPVSNSPLISAADGQQHYELFEGTTPDGGATWTWRPITCNSAVDNIRPIMPVWNSTQSVLLWSRGAMTTFRDYDLDIVGMFDPEPMNPDAPVITRSPDDVQAEAGQTVQFSVSVSSPLPVTYTWYHRNMEGVTQTAGADSNTLTRSDVQLEDEGYYYCHVANSAGSADSAEAALTIFVPVVPHLVAHWPLDNTYEDVSGNLHDATPQGSPVFVDPGSDGGQAVQFEGTNYLDVGSDPNFDLSAGCTLTAWIKTSSLGDQWASIIGKGVNAWRLCRYNSNSSAAFHVNTSVGALQANGEIAIIDDNWHFVVGTFDGQTVSLYIDGELDASSAASGTGTINVASDPVWIGGRSDSTERFWDGLIDDVQVYNYALDAEAVWLMYQDPSCPFRPAADFSGDCQVNIADLIMFSEKWLSVCADSSFDSAYDLVAIGSSDCKIDLADFAEFASHWLDDGFYP